MKFLLTFLLAIFSLNAMALDKCMSGSWYDPQRDGEGINVEVDATNMTVAYFYTFDRNESKAWYTLLGDGYLAMFDTFKVDDKYLEFRTETQLVGSAILEPLTPDAMYFIYQFDLEYKDGKKYECVTTPDFSCNGRYLYRRLTQPIPCGK